MDAGPGCHVEYDAQATQQQGPALGNARRLDSVMGPNLPVGFDVRYSTAYPSLTSCRRWQQRSAAAAAEFPRRQQYTRSLCCRTEGHCSCLECHIAGAAAAGLAFVFERKLGWTLQGVY